METSLDHNETRELEAAGRKMPNTHRLCLWMQISHPQATNRLRYPALKLDQCRRGRRSRMPPTRKAPTSRSRLMMLVTARRAERRSGVK
ncbi:unnamed protein product [Linum trigynum]|uniref:Uncharacterized protein n=1 Tax=Linum trigynum TaxID=586398 RepID=A0AAV2GQC4_9ROSI